MNRFSFDKYKDLFSLTLITSVLYFCGYLSSDYYDKILGIKINYDALEIIKWGADFFIYSVIDFFANLKTLGKDWLRFEFIIVICLDIIFLTIGKCKPPSCTTSFLKTMLTKCNFTRWSYVFCIVTVILSIHYLTLFIGKTDLHYLKILKLGNLNIIYSYFIIMNILNILNVFKSNGKSVWKNFIKCVLITPILFLPALYGVYGRSYSFNCIQKTLFETSILLKSHKGENYILERYYNCDTLEIIEKRCNETSYRYKIVNNEGYNLTVEKINFFEFIKDRYND